MVWPPIHKGNNFHRTKFAFDREKYLLHWLLLLNNVKNFSLLFSLREDSFTFKRSPM